MPDRTPIEKYTLKNSQGLEAVVITYGGVLQSLRVPDKNGKFEDIVLGFDDVDGYIKNGNVYFGATIGRFGNRLANGRFELDGKTYQGTVIYEAVDGLLLQTGPAETVRIPGDQIESQQSVPRSLMPAGLLDPLSDNELADLYAYLKDPRQ